MSRATSVYIFMIAFCAAGLWLILRVGGGLKAPTDLSGAWELTSYSPAPGGAPPRDAPPGDGGPRPILQVDQSGRFFELRFPDGRVLDLRADGESPPGPDGQPATVRMRNEAWALVARVGDEGRSLSGELTGPEGPAAFTARRAREGHKPAGRPNEPNRPAPTNPPPATRPAPAGEADGAAPGT